MNLQQIVVMIVGIFAVLLVLLALGETMGSEWTDTAQACAVAIVALGFFAIVISAVASRR